MLVGSHEQVDVGNEVRVDQRQLVDIPGNESFDVLVAIRDFLRRLCDLQRGLLFCVPHQLLDVLLNIVGLPFSDLDQLI